MPSSKGPDFELVPEFDPGDETNCYQTLFSSLPKNILLHGSFSFDKKYEILFTIGEMKNRKGS
jgi:hypothetical protein